MIPLILGGLAIAGIAKFLSKDTSSSSPTILFHDNEQTTTDNAKIEELKQARLRSKAIIINDFKKQLSCLYEENKKFINSENVSEPKKLKIYFEDKSIGITELIAAISPMIYADDSGKNYTNGQFKKHIKNLNIFLEDSIQPTPEGLVGHLKGLIPDTTFYSNYIEQEVKVETIKKQIEKIENYKKIISTAIDF